MDAVPCQAVHWCNIIKLRAPRPQDPGGFSAVSSATQLIHSFVAILLSCFHFLFHLFFSHMTRSFVWMTKTGGASTCLYHLTIQTLLITPEGQSNRASSWMGAEPSLLGLCSRLPSSTHFRPGTSAYQICSFVYSFGQLANWQNACQGSLCARCYSRPWASNW